MAVILFYSSADININPKSTLKDFALPQLLCGKMKNTLNTVSINSKIAFYALSFF